MTASPGLPRAATVEAFDAVADDEQLLGPGVQAPCRTLGLDATALHRFATGSLPVHAVGDAVLKLFPPPYAHEQPVETAVPRHGRWEMPAPWLDQVSAFLVSVGLDLGEPAGSEQLVLLHTEIMPANLLARRGEDDRWDLCGLVDLEPAMHGQREYELDALAIFLAEGDPIVLGAALDAYGYAPDQLDEAFRRRLMVWTLLHRCGNVATDLQRLPPPPDPTFEALADRWFTVGAPG